MGLLDRFTRSRDEVEADELRAEHEAGHQHIAECAPGMVVTVMGTVREVTQRPRSAVPTLMVEVFDGTGAITVVWLGRHSIRGIVPGRRLSATGRLTRRDGSMMMFNPRYVLKP
jgi:RecG-like helicase